MKASIIDLNGKIVGEIELPAQFNEEYHPNLIKRAVEAIHANKRQPYGSDPEAGKKASVRLSKRRRDYRASYGRGISRVPRKILLRRGSQFYFVGAFAPGTVGGRRAHPPKAEKDWSKKINKKERKKAIRSALSATFNKQLVESRGHKVPELYPFVLVDDFMNLKKTKDVKKTLEAIGLKEELERSAKKKIRAGKGKMRGRRYRKKTGPLLVVSDKCDLMKAASNIPGIDVVLVQNLNADLLAPGGVPGRLTLFTKSALLLMEKKKLFM